MAESPHIILLGGPNGAGKTTAAPKLLKGLLRITQYVNADTIARGLAGFEPEDAALAAGRIMLERMRELARRRVSFAIESTLASRTPAAWVQGELAEAGYEAHLVFLWLPSVEMAIARVKERVGFGGQDVSEHVVRRRYRASLRNLFGLYMPIVSTWRVYNNVAADGPVVVASGGGGRSTLVERSADWQSIVRQSQGG